MGQSNKIDQFFNSKLESLELEPAVGSWDQVQSQIGTKKSPWFVLAGKVAAAVIILIVSVFTYINLSSGTKSNLIGAIDHPVQLDNETQALEKIVVPEPKKEMILLAANAQKEPSIIDKANTEKKKPIERLDEEVEVFTIARIAINQDDFNVINEAKLPTLNTSGAVKSYDTKIKITYIASSENPDSEVNDGKLNRIITVAQNVSPSGLISDLRAAKNNLFETNILSRN